jgi:hypothetical protein
MTSPGRDWIGRSKFPRTRRNTRNEGMPCQVMKLAGARRSSNDGFQPFGFGRSSLHGNQTRHGDHHAVDANWGMRLVCDSSRNDAIRERISDAQGPRKRRKPRGKVCGVPTGNHSKDSCQKDRGLDMRVGASGPVLRGSLRCAIAGIRHGFWRTKSDPALSEYATMHRRQVLGRKGGLAALGVP